MEINQRPKLNLKITRLEFLFNSIALAVFIGSIGFLISAWTTLPSEVPAHYNGVGEVDRWGSKGEMLILPIIGLAMWIGMSVLEKYPHVYNYTNLTKENAREQYLNARMMINVLKNQMVFIFTYLTWKNIQIGLGNHDSLGVWFLPVFLLLIFGSMGYFIIKSFRLSKA